MIIKEIYADNNEDRLCGCIVYTYIINIFIMCIVSNLQE